MFARQGFAGATCRGHHVIEMRDSVERLAVRLDIPDVLERSGRKRIIADFDTVWTRLARCCDENRTHTHVLAAVALTLTHITADMVLRPLLEAKGAELHARLPLLVQTQGSCDFTLLCGLILMPELIQQVHRTSQDLLRAVHAALLPIAPTIYKKNRNDAITALLTEGLVKSLPNGDALDVNVRRVTSAAIEGLLHLPAKMSPPVFRKFFCDVATWCYDQTSFGDPFSTPVVRFLIGTARAGDAISRRRALSTLLRMDTAENTDANMPIEYHPDPPKWDADRFWDCYRGVHEAMEELADRSGGGDSYVLAHLQPISLRKAGPGSAACFHARCTNAESRHTGPETPGKVSRSPITVYNSTSGTRN
ncbi:hypothetical protein EXIGLDRAFT_831672 [Exidia glandulosa HHB12029]|uniref:Uncharacterized protein n=1 Tax=Exidia glandulosa HHB12029 TaxID=1314781 RepID=A0A165MDB0_EXIGL|nr:hypothetical protein EXIGLDRAFT_831672 [Exidia glandulosa HHB12029]